MAARDPTRAPYTQSLDKKGFYSRLLQLFKVEITFHTENWQQETIYILVFLPDKKRDIWPNEVLSKFYLKTFRQMDLGMNRKSFHKVRVVLWVMGGQELATSPSGQWHTLTLWVIA